MESVADVLGLTSQVVVIIGTGYAFYEYAVRARLRQRALERYLRRERAQEDDEGQRSVLHLMRQLRMTEGEVERAAYTSKRIEPRVTTDSESGLADAILFVYADDT